MALSRNEPNPLSVLGQRKLDFIPQHFTKIQTDRNIDIRLLDQWINYNLNSRYAIKKTHTLDNKNKVIEVYEIGMEDPKEITMFSLGCPYLHQKL